MLKRLKSLTIKELVTLQWLPKWRWYDLPNYVLNQLIVRDHAICLEDLQYVESEYAELARQQLDLYVPYQPRADRAVILFVHGGSWQHGNKQDYRFLAQSLAQSGFFVACMNYRLAPEHIYPDFVEDTILATNWLLDHSQSAEYGYNADKLILMGHSAGAFNISAALYHPDLHVKIEREDAIHALIGIAGTYSFEHRGDPIAQFALPQDIAPEHLMPNYYVQPNQIKHLLIVAGNDTLVADSNTEKMVQSLKDIGNHVEVKRIARTRHVNVIATLAEKFARFFPTKRLILDFIED
ncbi:alpha/beta hydrolase [Acinetobacter sp.]|uniref:alpha/beta hydrolase n=1 Tax=Acinetobacter sp. TaxID=472 RepID=UPI0035AF3A83